MQDKNYSKNYLKKIIKKIKIQIRKNELNVELHNIQLQRVLDLLNQDGGEQQN
jgi:hypothetical protein